MIILSFAQRAFGKIQYLLTMWVMEWLGIDTKDHKKIKACEHDL